MLLLVMCGLRRLNYLSLCLYHDHFTVGSYDIIKVKYYNGIDFFVVLERICEMWNVKIEHFYKSGGGLTRQTFTRWPFDIDGPCVVAYLKAHLVSWPSVIKTATSSGCFYLLGLMRCIFLNYLEICTFEHNFLNLTIITIINITLNYPWFQKRDIACLC